MMMGLLGAYRMGHRSVGACGSVLVSGLARLCCWLLLLLLLLEEVMLPVELLPLRIHDVEVSDSK